VPNEIIVGSASCETVILDVNLKRVYNEIEV